MKNNFPHVFSPLTIRGMTLKNRVVMMPMGSDFAGHDGELSDEHIKYYELRARGGTGLIMVENVCVKYPEGSNGTTQLRLDKDCYIPRLFTLTEACHRQGALMGIQINHAGVPESVCSRYLRRVFHQKPVERFRADFRKRRSQALQKIMEPLQRERSMPDLML